MPPTNGFDQFRTCSIMFTKVESYGCLKWSNTWDYHMLHQFLYVLFGVLFFNTLGMGFGRGWGRNLYWREIPRKCKSLALGKPLSLSSVYSPLNLSLLRRNSSGFWSKMLCKLSFAHSFTKSYWHLINEITVLPQHEGHGIFSLALQRFTKPKARNYFFSFVN